MHSLCPGCAKPLQSRNHSTCTKYPSRQGPEVRKGIYEFVKKGGFAPHIAGQYCLEIQETNTNQFSIHVPTTKRGVKKTRVSLSNLKKSNKVILSTDQMRNIYKVSEPGLSILAFK